VGRRRTPRSHHLHALGRRVWPLLHFTLLALALLVAWPAHTAVVLTEDFASHPTARGWQAFGQTNLFQWDDTNKHLLVTWDSAQPNSYFHRPLGDILTKSDDFTFAFDLRLDSVAVGLTPEKPSTFQLAVALCNLVQATRTNLFAGSGTSATTGLRSSVEFNYFPGADFEPTSSCIVVSSNNGSFSQFLFSHDFPLEFDTGVWHRIALAYTASNRTLTMTKTRAGAAFGVTQSITLGGTFTDFRLDTLAIASYHDAGQFPPPGSILAHGAVDNFTVTLPAPPVTQLQPALSNSTATVRFLSRSNWLYTLQHSADLVSWTNLPATATGTGAFLQLTNTGATAPKSFYRVNAERP
jgi:hypothetical protein